jgi:hypothetical protein
MASYLPVYCSACARASLSSKSEADPQICAFCEGPARVVPGPIYRDGDWLAFADIDSAVFDAALDGARASGLAEELQQMLAQQSDSQVIVERMIQQVPHLASCRPAMVNGIQRGLRMLTTLLVARSRDQQLSAENETLQQGSPTRHHTG